MFDDPQAVRGTTPVPHEEDAPLAPRAHGAVRNPTHPEYFDIGHRQLSDPVDALGDPVRRLVIDDHASLTRGDGARTATTAGVDALAADRWRVGPRSDVPGDPRRNLPDAQAPTS